MRHTVKRFIICFLHIQDLYDINFYFFIFIYIVFRQGQQGLRSAHCKAQGFAAGTIPAEVGVQQVDVNL